VEVAVSPPGAVSGSANEVTFDELPNGPLGLYVPNALPAQFSGSGVIQTDPALPSDATPYLSIPEGVGQEVISYGVEQTSFGFYWADAQALNTVTFYQTSIPGDIGTVVVSFNAAGAGLIFGDSRYVTFLFSGEFTSGFMSVVFTNPHLENFYIDNISTGVPEPAMWALMLIGFAGISFAAYRRTKKAALAVA
jgi:hypothetical protein